MFLCLKLSLFLVSGVEDVFVGYLFGRKKATEVAHVCVL